MIGSDLHWAPHWGIKPDNLGLRSGDATTLWLWLLLLMLCREEGTLSQLNERKRGRHSVSSSVWWKNVVDTERMSVSSAGEFSTQTTFLLFEGEKRKFLPALWLCHTTLFLFSFLLFLGNKPFKTNASHVMSRLTCSAFWQILTNFLPFLGFSPSRLLKEREPEKKILFLPFTVISATSSFSSCPVPYHQHCE